MNSQPSDYEPLPLSTRPGLPDFLFIYNCKFLLTLQTYSRYNSRVVIYHSRLLVTDIKNKIFRVIVILLGPSVNVLVASEADGDRNGHRADDEGALGEDELAGLQVPGRDDEPAHFGIARSTCLKMI